MQVKAIMTGYYNHKRRREGAVFELIPIKGNKVVEGKLVPHTYSVEDQFSKSWMQRLDSEPSEMRAVKSRKAKVIEEPTESSADSEVI